MPNSRGYVCWGSLLLASLACSEVAEVLTPPEASDMGTSTTVNISYGGATSVASSGSSTLGSAAGPGYSVSTTTTTSSSANSTAGDSMVSVVTLDTGIDHSCAAVRGKLFCWGGNQRGGLGVGDSQNRVWPTQVGVLETWVGVATAADHSCALRQNGSVWCFGANDYGQVGSPGVNDVLNPIGVALPGPALELSAEGNFSCALLADRSLYCWGENTEGTLAQNDAYPGENKFAPVRVGAFADWTQVDTGQGHACGLRLPGSLWCWGRNSRDQLGLGQSALDQYRSPQLVGSANNWTLIQAGQNHTCGLREPGELWCWGENAAGILGTGDFATRSTPVRINEGRYTSVSLNTFHTCAIDPNHDLWCWGRNSEGQLGLGDNEDRILPTRVIGGGFERVSVGGFHTCAMKTDQSIWCTGENVVGQLGVGDSQRRSEFTRVASLEQ